MPALVIYVCCLCYQRRCYGEGNGNPLQYSYLGNPMDRGAWQATVHGVTKESQLNDKTTREVIKFKRGHEALIQSDWYPCKERKLGHR